MLEFYYGNIPRSKPLCGLEVVNKFMVVVGVVCKPILVFSFGFDQAEQFCEFMSLSTSNGARPHKKN